MNWNQWYCTNQACAVEAWMVQRDPLARDAWWVATHADERPFAVAAIDPVCPSCGTTLLATVELESRLAEPAGAEVAAVLDRVPSVA